MRILVCEDEKTMNSSICTTLKNAGYYADSCYDGIESIDYALSGDYDLIIMDIMMPRMTGDRVVKEVRLHGVKTPVIFLSAMGGYYVKGLDAGGDYFIEKPFDSERLLAVIRKFVRSQAGTGTNILSCADLVVNILNRDVKRGGKPIRLTKQEYDFLEFLMVNKGQIKNKNDISKALSSYIGDEERTSNWVTVVINKLHHKIDDGFDKQLLVNYHGFGWSISEDRKI